MLHIYEGGVFLSECDFAYYFKRIHEAFVLESNRNLKKVGLTSSQMDILIYLFINEGKIITQRDIEKHFGLTHSTVIGILKRLAEKEYIYVKTDENDRRQRIVNLDKKSFKVKEDFLIEREKRINRFKDKLTKEEADTLINLLGKVYSVLKEEE